VTLTRYSSRSSRCDQSIPRQRIPSERSRRPREAVRRIKNIVSIKPADAITTIVTMI